MRSEQTDLEAIESLLNCIDGALLRICTYQERQTELLEKLVELSQKKRKPQERSTFKPPELAEVKKYVMEIGSSISAEGFIDYYQARGWKLNNGTQVKDWRACVRTWERNGFNKAPKENDKTGVVL